jgi:hypothetical protein
MAKFKNEHPLGDLEVPALGRVIKAGETFEVPDAEAGLYTALTPVDKPAKAGVAAALAPPQDEAGTVAGGPDAAAEPAQDSKEAAK